MRKRKYYLNVRIDRNEYGHLVELVDRTGRSCSSLVRSIIKDIMVPEKPNVELLRFRAKIRRSQVNLRSISKMCSDEKIYHAIECLTRFDNDFAKRYLIPKINFWTTGPKVETGDKITSGPVVQKLKRDYRFRLYLDEGEQTKIKEDARKIGINKSELVRRKIRDYKTMEAPGQDFYEEAKDIDEMGERINFIKIKLHNGDFVSEDSIKDLCQKINEYIMRVNKFI